MTDLLAGIAEFLTDPGTYQGRSALQALVLQHLYYTVAGTVIAAAIAMPVGLWVGHRRRGDLLAVSIANTGRAIPDFGIMLLALVVLGLGDGPVLIALVALAIPPILINTYVGIRQVDPDARDAGEGMGMAGWGVLLRVEIPNAVPLIMTGVRTAAVQVLATATLAAYLGLGGLGRLIFDGFAAGVVRGDRPGLPRLVLGSVLVALLAVAVELALGRLEHVLTPRGLRRAGRDLPGGQPGPDEETLRARAAA
jgi:osmoprotectant transport system permease protein